MNFGIFILIICCFWSINAIVIPATVCCGGSFHNRNEGICCNEVFSKGPISVGNTSKRCCGKQTYQYPTQLCYYDRLFENPYEFNGAICGEEVYDKRENSCCQSSDMFSVISVKDKICCNGKVLDNQFGKYGRCCRDQVINGQEYTCCGTKTYKANKMLSCCAGEVFNIRLAFCSNSNKVIPIPPYGFGVCHETQYQFNRSMCCNNVLRELPPIGTAKSLSCCGTNIYDPKKKVCCLPKNVLVDKPTDPDASYQCCGTEVYNTGEKLCCKNTLADDDYGFRCCGTRSYNPASNVCCNEQILPKVDNKIGCCNGELYDPKLQECCRLKLYDIPAAGKCNKECEAQRLLSGLGL